MPARKVVKRKLRVNLLYPQGVPQKIYLKFFRWLLAYGRFIVIVVELIVIGAFIARFKYDSELAELKQSINRQIPVIDSLYEEEQAIRQTQFRLTQTKKVLQNEPDWQVILKSISNQLPLGVRLASINLDYTENALELRINGEAKTNNDLALMLNGFRQDPYFQNIDLVGLTVNEGILSFSIIGEVKQVMNQP